MSETAYIMLASIVNNHFQPTIQDATVSVEEGVRPMPAQKHQA